MNSKKSNLFIVRSLLATGLACGTGQVIAYEADDIILRAGVASVQPDESSSALKLDGAALAGTGVGVDHSEALGLTATYMLSSKVGIGLLAATPFDHDLKANGLAGGIDAGSSKQLPPTLTLQYFPNDSAAAFQPYVGIGVNYTLFFSEDVDSELEAVLGKGDLKIDDSIGLAAQAGFDYAVDDHWLLNASIWYIDIDTDAEFKFDSGSRVKADVDIDPWVYMVGVGYKF
ncbi:MAG: outer membrane beta-barrel protein [Porticoccaceae bacterium]|nr:outer membrane beta-barrel protein [Porticoccaceae bacterium]